MYYPFTASEDSISVFFSGKMHSIPSTDGGFAELSEHLKSGDHDFSIIERLVDKQKLIARMIEGDVQVSGDTVYYKGQPIHNSLATKLVNLLNAGYDAKPWARFMYRVMMNPSERSRECLFDFLTNWDAPIDADGCFIAFKNVRQDYKDIHSGTFDNSPGAYVSMPREEVNSNPDETCSRGLHVAASSYLDHYGHGARTIAVRVAPEDVVAVPRDYGFAKMRVCAYTVLGDAERSFVNNAHTTNVYGIAPKIEEAASEVDIDGIVDYDEDDPYCGECGSNTVDFEGEVCDECEQEEMDQWHEMCDEQTDRMREEECIEETGCTLDGEPVDVDHYFNHYGAGHNVGRFTDDDIYEGGEDTVGTKCRVDDTDGTDSDPYLYESDDEPSEMSFTRAGVTYWASQITAGVEAHGQRAFARMTGVPRTTVQEWLKKID